MAQDRATGKLGETWFNNLVAQLWTQVAPNLSVIISETIKSFKRELPDSSDIGWNDWCDKMVKENYLPQDTANLLKTVALEPFPLDFVMMLMTRLGLITADVKVMTEAFSADRQYKAMETTQPHPAPVEALIRSMIIDPKRSTENRQHLKRHGYDNTQIDNLILAAYRTIDEGTLRTLFLRGVIDGEKLYERMYELGYTKTRIQEIIQTWEVIPGPGDLFTMVAKEAFEPDMYKKLGLNQEFPTEQVVWLNKQGISTEWAKKYWIAHWEQPSLGQGFEMLHRGVINEATLDLLFRAVEIPSFWRNKLTAIAYNPYTRVDARRMADLGVLPPEELLKAYTDIGYDATKAAKMVEFTLKFNAGPQKELTRGAILDSYEAGLIDKKTAKSLLTAQDYSSDLADYYLVLSDYNEAKKTQNLAIDNIKTRFLLRKISTASATTSLTRTGMDSSRIAALLENWSLEAYQYELLPSKTELTNFLLKGIISETQYRGTMSQHGYDAVSIQWYLDELLTATAISARRPSKAELGRFLTKGIIQPSEYITEMKALGYSEDYITMYISDLS